MNIALSLSLADARKVLDFLDTLEPTLDTEGPLKLSKLYTLTDPTALVTTGTPDTTTHEQPIAPLEPVAASSFVEADEPVTVAKPLDEVTEVIEPELELVAVSASDKAFRTDVTESAPVEEARVDIQEVRAAVQQAVQRLDAMYTHGNSNSTGRIINRLDEICGCKKVTDIPFGRYSDVIAGLATLGV